MELPILLYRKRKECLKHITKGIDVASTIASQTRVEITREIAK